MKFSTITTLCFASVAVALPQVSTRQAYAACDTGLYSSSVCCATDVLGVADLDCAQPPSTPTSAENFTDICAEIGQRARCCVLPILEQGVLCQDPPGT